LYAAVGDVRTRKIPGLACIFICAAAAARIASGGLTPFAALCGLAAGGLPWLAAALIKKGSVGGGDVKLFAASGLFLGFDGACFTVIAVCLILLCVYAVKKLRHRLSPGDAVAMAPYIAAGGAAAYILILIGG